MRPAWRLATRNLRARPKRTALLVSAVALSALLIAAVATAMASIQGSIQERVGKQIGLADIRIQGAGTGETIDAGWIQEARTWPGVAAVMGHIEHPMSLRASIELWRPVDPDAPDGPHALTPVQSLVNAMGHGVEPDGDAELQSIELIEGRLPIAPNEIAIDSLLAERLAGRRGEAGALGGAVQQSDVMLEEGQGVESGERIDASEASRLNEAVQVGVGDRIELVSRFLLRNIETFEIVGIVRPPPLGGRPQAFVDRARLAELAGRPGRVSSVDVLLEPKVDAEAFAEARRGELNESQAKAVLIQTTAKITSGLNQNLRTGRIGMVFASVMSFLAASFIIMTGLTVDVAERQRELAILRCIGSGRSQLAESQMAVGLLIGGIGALIGTPLGVAGCAVLFWFFRDSLQTGLVLSWWPVALAGTGAIVAGLFGAAWPAYTASSTSPLRAMSPRAAPTASGPIVLTTVAALIGIAVQFVTAGVPEDGRTAFWLYALIGLPCMFVSYFMLGVPLTLLVVRVIGPLISGALRLPKQLLERTIAQTPYRFGFTAGAMMAGLALMINIWTHGGSIGRDFLSSFTFPDAFVSGFALTPDAQERLNEMPFVTGTCAISLFPIETDAFGVTNLTKYASTFIAFEPEPFFELAELTWIEGSEESALPRLIEGGAVIVAREFQIAQGLGVGDTFVCTANDRRHEFEIVGVVTSPGLDIVSKYFNIGEEYTQQAIHSVFGSRRDMIELFGFDTINLIQIEFAEGTDDAAAIETIRRELFSYGIMDAGSGRMIKEQIMSVFAGALGAFSAVAVCAMLVACLGVANLIIAGIDARRYEFGVLRAVGAHRGVLLRLVIGEAVVIAICAIILGSAMGLQASWAGQRLHRLLIGLDLHLFVPVIGVVIGWGTVTVVTILAAVPAGLTIMKAKPRDLLASRG